MKVLNYIFLTLIIIGAINWGIQGLFNMDLVGSIFGGMSSVISRIVYVLVGIAGIWAFTLYSKIDEDHS